LSKLENGIDVTDSEIGVRLKQAGVFDGMSKVEQEEYWNDFKEQLVGTQGYLASLKISGNNTEANTGDTATNTGDTANNTDEKSELQAALEAIANNTAGASL
jgi:hypothetical protein